jgi:outer membrane protein TolC
LKATKLLLLLIASVSLKAQLTVAQAVETALRNYPSVRVSEEQVNAAAAGIELARTAYLPRLDALAQANRATRNNVFGMLLPQSVIPSISGPVLGTNNLGTAWGSAVGGLVSWEPFDFGLRRTQYDVAVATADAYLTLVAAQETARAAQAGVDGAEVILRTTNAQVNAELRPGADASRAQAELAAARTEFIRAQQAIEIARATVSQFAGAEPGTIVPAAPKLLELPPEENVAPLNTAANPIAVEQNAVVEQAAQLRALERSYFPRFNLQGAAYLRGTSAETDGKLLGGLNGLAPNVQNYALGFSVSFPVFDLAAIRARENAQAATVRVQTARSQQIATDLRAQWNQAVATLRGAR